FIEGNRRANDLVCTPVAIALVGQARLSHEFFHQSAKTLWVKFGLSVIDARAIVVACLDCACLPNLQGGAVNLRGLKALKLWQTDVTEFPSFGRMRYIQVSINMFLGLIWSTAL
ncbi:POK8 protein, partial [Chauna torquata]|nr:POK8 protein [Chauna torquata]